MKTKTLSFCVSRDSQPTSLFRNALLLGLALCFVGSATRVSAQAPVLLWSTNIGATLFAVDNQTNSYARVGGSVIVINPSGIPVSTNVICPIPGVAQRDALGNYYFAGNFEGTQNFGGITLVGGWTNSPAPGGWSPGYATHFIAKYNSAGVLQWVKSFGQQAQTQNKFQDFVVDASGGVHLGHLGFGFNSGSPAITRFDPSGVFLSSFVGGSGFNISMRVGSLTTSNIAFTRVNSALVEVAGSRVSQAGVFSSWPAGGTPWTKYVSSDATNGRPVMDNQGRIFQAGICGDPGCGNVAVLRKFAFDGTPVWTVNIANHEQWVLQRDNQENVYLAGTNGLFSKFDVNGSLLWTTNYAKRGANMVVDAAGNRFVQFTDGSVARLAGDFAPQPPSILVGPQTQIVSLSSSATFSVSASGSPALYYQWRKDGTNLPSSTVTNHTIAVVTTNHVGSYAVVVTNVYGSVTSAPASLLISPSLVSPYTGTIGVWGQEATLSVSAWGSGTLTYQWYRAGQLLSGATNDTLVFPSLQITNGGLYSVVVSSEYGVVTNTPAELVVNPANISLGLYAGVIIDGTAGYTYGIEYATNLTTPTWNSLTNVTLTQPVQIWVDTSVNVPNAPKRFYRVTSQ